MRNPLIVLIVACMTYCKAQIQPGIYGQNANLTATVGINNNAGGLLDNYWKTTGPLSAQNYVKESRVEFMRYGGIQVEQDCQLDGSPTTPNSNIDLTIRDYIAKAKAMQDNNMTPMMTLPLRIVPITIPDFTVAAQKAALLVQNVNNTLTATPKPGGGNYAAVKYWVYSNEPEAGSNHNYDNANAPQIIHDYIKAYYTEVMAIWQPAWGTPKFVGPELLSYDNYDHGAPLKVDKLIQQLLGIPNPYSVTYSITPYINVFSWHYYPFNDESSADPNIPAPTRANVVNYLGTGAPSSANTFTTRPLIQDINEIKSWLPAGIEIAITEVNICHKNDVANTYTPAASGTDDLVTGNGANSFIAGQFWAEMLSICMEGNVNIVNFWSSIEGCDTQAGCTDPNYKTNIGYLNSDPNKVDGIGAKKSTYHHFKMLSDNFRGQYYKGAYVQNGVTPAPTFSNGIKAFASVEAAGVKIMVLNQNEQAYNYHINFSGTSNAAGRVTLNFPAISSNSLIAGTMTNTAYNSTISIPARSTVLLTFDCHGDFASLVDYTEADAIGGIAPRYKFIGNTPVDQNTFNCRLTGGIGGNISSKTTYTNDTVYVSSDLKLMGSSVLTFSNCIVIMAEGTKIEVNPNNTLKIVNTTIVGCSGKTWKGIEMKGNYQSGLRLLVENSAILNAIVAVKAEKTGDLKITKSVLANGQTAIELDRCEAFTITENLIVGFNTGVRTGKTKADFVSTISDNRFIDMKTALAFVDDNHNKLDVFCNAFLYRQEGIKSQNTDLKEFGTASVGAGNMFFKLSAGTPVDFLDHSGISTKYFYDPSKIVEFSSPSVMNIPTVMAATDRVCKQAFATNCTSWTIGIKEQTNMAHDGLQIYPNPSSGMFNLIASNLHGEYTLNIHDVLGRLINTKKLNLDSGKIVTFEILSGGLYFVTLENKENRITKKVTVE